MGQMMRAWERYGDAVVAVQEVSRQEVRHYGIIDGVKVGDRIFEVKDMVEKPEPEEAPSNLAIIGRYILPPLIFDLLEETVPDQGGEIQLTDALRALLKRRAIYGYQFEGKRYDAGNKLGFLKATVEFALKRQDLAKEFGAYLKSLNL